MLSRTVCNSSFSRAYGFPSLVAESVIQERDVCLYLYQGSVSFYSRTENSLTVVWVVLSEVTQVPSLHSNQLEILLLLSPPPVKEGWESLLKSFPHLLQVVSRKVEKITFPYWDCHTQNSTCRDAGISFHALAVKVYV